MVGRAGGEDAALYPGSFSWLTSHQEKVGQREDMRNEMGRREVRERDRGHTCTLVATTTGPPDEVITCRA